MRGNKVPEPPRTFVEGPALTPTNTLLDWLRSHNTLRIRVPIIVHFHHPLGVKEAFVGTLDTNEHDRIPVALYDGAMGISLYEYLCSECSRDCEQAVAWLEGCWRAGPLPSFLQKNDKESFTVYRLHKLFEATEQARVWYEVAP